AITSLPLSPRVVQSPGKPVPCSDVRAVANAAAGTVSIQPVTKANKTKLVERVRGWLPKKKRRPGSGIPPRKVIQVLVWARRFAQVGFFALFFYFLAQTAFRGTFAANSDEPVRLPLPVEGFLLADPFVAAMTLLSTHTIYRGLAWALVIVALTIVFGRVFCGWICPFGTLHHFFGWLFPS